MNVGFDAPLYILRSITVARSRRMKTTREAAVAEIARRYREFVNICEKAGRVKRTERVGRATWAQ